MRFINKTSCNGFLPSGSELTFLPTVKVRRRQCMCRLDLWNSNELGSSSGSGQQNRFWVYCPRRTSQMHAQMLVTVSPSSVKSTGKDAGVLGLATQHSRELSCAWQTWHCLQVACAIKREWSFYSEAVRFGRNPPVIANSKDCLPVRDTSFA